MKKRYPRQFIPGLALLLILCFLFLMLPLENSKTLAGIALINITNSNVVVHPIFKNTYIVKAKYNSENGFDIFVEYMRNKGYILDERLGSMWVFKKDSEKLVLVSSYKHIKLFDNSPVIIFNP